MSAELEKLEALEKKMDRLEKLTVLSTKDVLTVSEAALLMSVSEDHIRKLTSHREGQAPLLGYSQPGGKLKFIEKEELVAYMRQNKVFGRLELMNEIQQEKIRA